VSSLPDIGLRIRTAYEAKYAARDKALQLCRETTRSSAVAIRAIHRGEFDAALGHIESARQALVLARTTLAEHPDVLFAGFVHDAAKEYVEASTTLAIIREQPLPEPDALGVEFPAYLNGMAEAVGELRRHLLDRLRHGDVDSCERVLAVMDEIFSLLVTIDYPDSITGGLRRATDVSRGIIEKTRGDLTLAVRQQDLERHLGRLEQGLRE
jgi:translin